MAARIRDCSEGCACPVDRLARRERTSASLLPPARLLFRDAEVRKGWRVAKSRSKSCNAAISTSPSRGWPPKAAPGSPERTASAAVACLDNELHAHVAACVRPSSTLAGSTTSGRHRPRIEGYVFETTRCHSQPMAAGSGAVVGVIGSDRLDRRLKCQDPKVPLAAEILRRDPCSLSSTSPF
jgi:hypothetical protein